MQLWVKINFSIGWNIIKSILYRRNWILKKWTVKKEIWMSKNTTDKKCTKHEKGCQKLNTKLEPWSIKTMNKPRVRISSVLKQNLNHFSSSRPMQRSLVQEPLLAHDARDGPVLEQQAHDLLVGRLGHDVEGAVAPWVAGVDVGPGIDQQPEIIWREKWVQKIVLVEEDGLTP